MSFSIPHESALYNVNTTQKSITFIVVDVYNVLILPNIVVVANSQKSSLDQLLVELIYVIANIYAKKQEYVSSINANEIKAKMLL